MEYRALGPLEVWQGDESLPLGGAKQRALLALLLLNAQRARRRPRRLVDELWGEEPPATAVKTVQVYVSQLRKTLGPDSLETRPPGTCLRSSPSGSTCSASSGCSGEGREALAGGDAAEAARCCARRSVSGAGPALADFRTSRSRATRPAGSRSSASSRRSSSGSRPTSRSAATPSDRRARGARPRASAAGEPARAADAGALPCRPAGRRARRLPADARAALVEELGLDPGESLQRLEKAILSPRPVARPPACRRAVGAAACQRRRARGPPDRRRLRTRAGRRTRAAPSTATRAARR